MSNLQSGTGVGRDPNRAARQNALCRVAGDLGRGHRAAELGARVAGSERVRAQREHEGCGDGGRRMSIDE